MFVRRPFRIALFSLSAVAVLSTLIIVPANTQSGGSFVALQGTTPGTSQTGNIHVSGIGKFGGFRLGNSSTSGWILTTDANGVGTWAPPSGGLTLPFTGTANVSTPNSQVFSITNTYTGSNIVSAAYFQANGNNSIGVQGIVSAGQSQGGFFASSGNLGIGVSGLASSSSGNVSGVFGRTFSTTGKGVYGLASSTTGVNYGVYGQTSSASGFAGYFQGPVEATGLTTLTGGLRVPTGATAGFVLTSDGTGNATWQAPAGGGSYSAGAGLLLTGNVFSIANLGITNAMLAANAVDSAKIADLSIATGDIADDAITNTKLANDAASLNKVSAGNLTISGANVGVGGTPTTKLDVFGTAKMTGFQLGSSTTSGFVLTANASGVGTWQAAGSLSVPNPLLLTNSLTTAPIIRGTNTAAGGSGEGTGVLGEQTAASGSSSGVYGKSASTNGTGTVGYATSATGPTVGTYGIAVSSTGKGAVGHATSTSGVNYGVYGETASAAGYAGFFSGRGYFSGNVGIGNLSPSSALDVNGTAKMTGFQLGTTTTAGFVLTANASGVGTWQAPPGGGGSYSAGAGLQLTGNVFSIANLGVTNAMLAANSVDSGKILDGSIGSLDIANSAIDTPRLADNAVGSTKLVSDPGSINKVSGGLMTISGVNLGVGGTPTTKLDVFGTAKMTGFQLGTSATAGQVLTANSSGIGTWQTAPGVPNPLALSGSSVGPIISATNSNTTAGASAIFGDSTATNGTVYGVYGKSASSTGIGVFGRDVSTSASAYGIRGDSTNGTAVFGFATANTGINYGVFGQTNSASGYGGYFNGRGYVRDELGVGITNPTAKLHVNGNSRIESNYGSDLLVANNLSSADYSSSIFAQHSGATGITIGIVATCVSPSGRAVWGAATGANAHAGYFEGRGYFSDNVGIGTASPDAKLRVVGTAKVDTLEIAGAGDVAEKFTVTGGAKPGDVVEIDPNIPGQLRVCKNPYSKCVAGVVSGANGLRAGVVLDPTKKNSGSLAVALTGKVWVRCTATHNAVKPGDLIVSAGKGMAMAASNKQSATGAVLGKAMSNLKKGETGFVLVLVSLQ